MGSSYIIKPPFLLKKVYGNTKVWNFYIDMTDSTGIIIYIYIYIYMCVCVCVCVYIFFFFQSNSKLKLVRSLAVCEESSAPFVDGPLETQVGPLWVSIAFEFGGCLLNSHVTTMASTLGLEIGVEKASKQVVAVKWHEWEHEV